MKATEALQALDPSVSREEWVKILAAFKAAGGDMETANDWSAQAHNYDPRNFVATWKSIKAHGGIGEGTLFYLAKQMGHKPRSEAPQRAFQERLAGTRGYAKGIWQMSKSGVANHPYAIRKKIDHDFGALRGTASGFLLGKHADVISVPMRDWTGAFTGVECINRDGVKQTFGNKGHLVVGCPEDAPIIHVTEGWASMFAITQIAPQSFGGVVAFGSGSRMEKIANEAAKKFGGRVLIHDEGKDNRDIWDYWMDGIGEKWIERAIRRLRGNS